MPLVTGDEFQGLASSEFGRGGYRDSVLATGASVLVTANRARARRGEATNRKMAAISAALGALVTVLGIVITFSTVDKLGKDLQNIGHDPAALSREPVPELTLEPFRSSMGNGPTRCTGWGRSLMLGQSDSPAHTPAMLGKGALSPRSSAATR